MRCAALVVACLLAGLGQPAGAALEGKAMEADPPAGQSLVVCVYSRAPFMIRAEAEGGGSAHGKSVEGGGTAQPTSGIEHDILASFAQATGRSLDLRWVRSDLDTMLGKLETGECDLVSAMLTPTREREEKVDFSASYFPVRMVLLGRRGHGLHGEGGLDGARVATLRSASYEEVLAGLDSIERVYGQHFPDLLRLVVSGEADALVCDSSLVVPLLERHPDLEIGPSLSGTQHYAFALKKGSALTAELDSHLQALKEDGRYAEILRRYLDEAVVEMILEVE